MNKKSIIMNQAAILVVVLCIFCAMGAKAEEIVLKRAERRALQQHELLDERRGLVLAGSVKECGRKRPTQTTIKNFGDSMIWNKANLTLTRMVST